MSTAVSLSFSPTSKFANDIDRSYNRPRWWFRVKFNLKALVQVQEFKIYSRSFHLYLWIFSAAATTYMFKCTYNFKV